MGGRHPLFCDERFPHHLHSARNAGQAALLPQLSCAQSAARLAGIFAGPGGCLFERADWFVGGTVWHAIKTAPWLAYIFCVQNLFHLALPPALGPSWALAIEEQYYFVWAPVVRFLRATVDAGGGAGGRAGCIANAASCEPALDDADEHTDSSGRDRAGQFAGAGVLHAHAQPPQHGS